MNNHDSLRIDFAGKNNFTWWQGVVEDIMDPLKLGRARVRIFGWHNPNKEQIPTSDLPWASVMMPANNPSISGKGWSPNGLVAGCWVIGFFRDGYFGQDPVIMGSLPGLNPIEPLVPSDDAAPMEVRMNPESLNAWKQQKIAENRRKSDNLRKVMETDDVSRNSAGGVINMTDYPQNPMVDTSSGFYDPSGIYPLVSRMDEPDTNRLARRDKITSTIVQSKTEMMVGPIETAIAGSWNEPDPAYNASYPHNHVYESESGHVVEYDDTPGAERMHWYHRSGTFTEVHPLGGEVHKVVSNAWDITVGDKMIYVKGNASFNCDKVVKIMMGRDLDIEIGGDVKMFVKGNMTTDVMGNYFLKVRGFYTAVADLGMTFVSPRIDLNPIGLIAQTLRTGIDFLRGTIKSVTSKASGTIPGGSFVASAISSAVSSGNVNNNSNDVIDDLGLANSDEFERSAAINLIDEERREERNRRRIEMEANSQLGVGSTEEAIASLVTSRGAVSGYADARGIKNNKTNELLEKLNESNPG